MRRTSARMAWVRYSRSLGMADFSEGTDGTWHEKQRTCSTRQQRKRIKVAVGSLAPVEHVSSSTARMVGVKNSHYDDISKNCIHMAGIRRLFRQTLLLSRAV